MHRVRTTQNYRLITCFAAIAGVTFCSDGNGASIYESTVLADGPVAYY